VTSSAPIVVGVADGHEVPGDVDKEVGAGSVAARAIAAGTSAASKVTAPTAVSDIPHRLPGEWDKGRLGMRRRRVIDPLLK
jgi:hypothetical protein